MNVGALFDLTAGYAASRRRSSRSSGPSAFAESLAAERESFSHRFIQSPAFSLRMGENILCSGGVGGANAQTYEAEFTDDSTDEDPVVRIRGKANSGTFDHTCHIRDIDPSNASYAELAALNRWLCRTGAYRTEFSSREGSVLPCGMDCGDVSKKRNFISGLQDFIASASNPHHYPKYGPETYAHARELLEAYRRFSRDA
nr:hypothetical protein [uncultured Oscillibacter sp.]